MKKLFSCIAKFRFGHSATEMLEVRAIEAILDVNLDLQNGVTLICTFYVLDELISFRKLKIEKIGHFAQRTLTSGRFTYENFCLYL